MTATSISNDSGWTLRMDEDLVSMVQTSCNKIGIEPVSLDAIMLSPEPDDLIRFKSLEKTPLDVLRARFALIKYLNRLVTPLLHYVDIRVYQKPLNENKTKKNEISPFDEERFDINSLSYIVHSLKGLYFMSTKKSVFDALMAAGTSQVSNSNRGPRVQINRMKAAKGKENPAKDPDGECSVFGQLFKQLRVKKYQSFRGSKKQQMFQVTFLGEGSIDVGGPYRECITQACADLMSSTVPLFIQCPNKTNNVGLNREKWIVNPGCNSVFQSAMYEFVGVLMGIALRTGETLNLDLDVILWKKLLGVKVGVNDLKGIDHLCVQALTSLKNLSQEKFEEMVTESYTTQLSNGAEVELKEGGRECPVKYSDVNEFIELSFQKRLCENDQQIRAIKKGLSVVVPPNLLSLFAWQDLELMVCGNPQIDIEVLRKHTKYRNIQSTAALITNLWRVLESFNTEERQMFLRFVWGRSRLPISESDWSQEFTIHALDAGNDKLPIAHTCFFSLELPQYTSYDIMRKKLLFSIFNCQAIDVDFDPGSSSMIVAD